MPAPGAGFGATAGLEIERVLVEVTVAQFLNQTLELSEGRGARFVLTTLGAHVCYALTGGRTVVSPCLGATGLRLSGEGFGPNATSSGSGSTEDRPSARRSAGARPTF